jgi:hypothetical protein
MAARRFCKLAGSDTSKSPNMFIAMTNMRMASKICTAALPASEPATRPERAATRPSGTNSAARPCTKAVESIMARPRVSRRAPKTDTVMPIMG